MASGVFPQHDTSFASCYESGTMPETGAAQFDAALVDSSLSIATQPTDEVESEEPCVDIIISNVVCTFNTRCHLNLKRIATEGMNVVYKREQGMVSMKLRHPKITASIWSSGKVTCTGAQSEEDAKVAGRRVARCLQNIGFKVRFTSFKIVNVLGTCSLPFGIRINHFSRDHPGVASYEPELHPGVTYRLKSPKACLKIFSTGSITVTAPSIANVQAAIEHIYPLVQQYKMDKVELRDPVSAAVAVGGCSDAFVLHQRKRPWQRNSRDMEDDDEF
jgi:TATA-box binding protein (TBP) (component of TFIID and TFIIIB)